ncbi:hypothetical protein DFH28DRAFT_1220004 [Melampsora americana]|nr:hypothetical protein DFH28DRAFT_1220004 [Melampsora americana]
MSRTDRRQLSHPCRIHYVGECGEEGPAPKPINKGFLSHHAAIVTSGMNEGSSFSNGIYLTSYGSQSDSITPGGLYAMTCKMIGTNDKNEDHFHFENSNRFNLGSVEHVGINMTNEAMDKVTMIGLGIIVAKDVIKDPLYKGKPTVIATLKHTDYDPFTRMSVSWCTKHFIPPMKNMEAAQRLCVVGREAQFSGLIKDYDGEKFMWECETTSISITSGHLTDIPQSPVKIAGRPAGGRIALTTPVKSSPAWNADEQSTDPYLGANGTGGSSSEAGPSSETNQSSTSDVTDNGKCVALPAKRTRRE